MNNSVANIFIKLNYAFELNCLFSVKDQQFSSCLCLCALTYVFVVSNNSSLFIIPYWSWSLFCLSSSTVGEDLWYTPTKEDIAKADRFQSNTSDEGFGSMSWRLKPQSPEEEFDRLNVHTVPISFYLVPIKNKTTELNANQPWFCCEYEYIHTSNVLHQTWI